MALNNPSAGFFNSSEYQSAGLPWCYTAVASSSIQQLNFPLVTRSITFSNLSTTATDRIELTFANPTGSVECRFSVMGNQTVELPLRVKSMWVSASQGSPEFSCLAALTTVRSREMPDLLSGSWQGV